jgi:hypothetical protein
MSVQDDKAAGQEGEHEVSEETGQMAEKPEVNDDAKQKAAEMMVAYEDRPTLVLPGSGGAISGTAVNDWVDEDGNPKYGDDSDADNKDQVEKDKALNAKLKKLAAEENKGEKRPPR